MSGRRILVVDDDADIVEYLSALLEDNGYEVRGADRSLDALAMLETFAADVVIIDVLMPGQSGLDLMVQIRKDRRWRALPVVMLTGNDEVLKDGGKSYVSTHEGIRGADELLGKPLDPEELFGALERVCSGSPPHESAPGA
jgi:two-component system phosphate regulon response regulator OmpR